MARGLETCCVLLAYFAELIDDNDSGGRKSGALIDDEQNGVWDGW